MRSRNVSILRSDVQMESDLTAAMSSMSLAEEDLDTQVHYVKSVDTYNIIIIHKNKQPYL